MNKSTSTKKPSSLFYGFSIFSMFFGSGNLVFPLMVGASNPDYWLVAFAGFFITGIILPFLGLFVIKLYKGSYLSFFGEAGSFAKLFIPFFTLSLLGPFGVIPRCITVAHGGLEFLNTNIPLSLFSFAFCIICYFACQNHERMFHILGKILTPILLTGLITLFFAGYIQIDHIIDSGISHESFTDGFMQGYITMDLFAAFFFSGLVFKQIETSIVGDEKTIIKAALKPSLVGAGILALVYFGFVFLGSHYHFLANGLTSELILPAIASHLFGSTGTLIVAIIMVLSCLTTSVALSGIYVNYLHSFKMAQGQKTNHILLASLLIAFIISMLDFEGILAWLVPLLDISYPGLIMLTLTCLLTRKRRKLKTFLFYSTIIIASLL